MLRIDSSSVDPLRGIPTMKILSGDFEYSFSLISIFSDLTSNALDFLIKLSALEGFRVSFNLFNLE